MFNKIGPLLITLMITFALSACGSDKAAESTMSPEPSPNAVGETASPTESSTAAPVATAAESTATPKASQTATASPKPAATASPAATVKPTEPPKLVESGATAEALFKQSCTSCHGVDLEGDFGPNLQKVGGRLTKDQITTQITDGGTSMPPFGKRLKAEEIQTLAVWLAAKK